MTPRATTLAGMSLAAGDDNKGAGTRPRSASGEERAPARHGAATHAERPSSSSEARPPDERRTLKQRALELWHRPSRQRLQGQRFDAADAKAIVDGLSRQELMLGAAGAALDVAFTLVAYFADRHSSTLVYREAASFVLLAGLVTSALMGLGAALRRRALLSFASFLAGMAMLSFAGVEGILYLGFGGWLIFRVMRKQRQDRATGMAMGSTSATRRPKPATKATPSAAPSAPASASKRYTPPRRSKAASTRRR